MNISGDEKTSGFVPLVFLYPLGFGYPFGGGSKGKVWWIGYVVAPIWRDNVQVVGRAAWGRSCGSAKLLAWTLRCLRLLLSAFGILVTRETVGALPQTPAEAPPLHPARGNFPLDPFRAIELVAFPILLPRVYSSFAACCVFILLVLRLSPFFPSPYLTIR